MIAWGFVGIRIVLPAGPKLIIRISPSWANPISKLMPFRFWSFGLFEWSCIFTCLGFDGFWLCFGQQRMVHKTWDGGKDQNCSQDYKSFLLLTTSKSVIINEASEENLIIDHPGFRPKNWIHRPIKRTMQWKKADVRILILGSTRQGGGTVKDTLQREYCEWCRWQRGSSWSVHHSLSCSWVIATELPPFAAFE